MVGEALDSGQRWRAAAPLTTDEAIELLLEARLEVEGRLIEASNTTLYCQLHPPAGPLAGVSEPLRHAIYKPVRGERPLHDFPDGSLARRERAAWLISGAAGWSIVPPTVIRDGPLGLGMVQLWIDVDPEVDVLELVLTRDDRLRPMALFDVIANNADRKGGHILVTSDDDVHGCDHGICFAAEPKLRTLLWGWAGEALNAAETEAVERLRVALRGDLGEELAALLDRDEVEALVRRIDDLIDKPRFPHPDPSRRVIPWPPF